MEGCLAVSVCGESLHLHRYLAVLTLLNTNLMSHFGIFCQLAIELMAYEHLKRVWQGQKQNPSAVAVSVVVTAKGTYRTDVGENIPGTGWCKCFTLLKDCLAGYRVWDARFI